MLDRVTITGADDSIKADELAAISAEFPFVEWGILLSKNSAGQRRFPSAEWLWDFRAIARRNHLKASLHVCGRWLRQMLIGETPQEIWSFIDCVQRVQLNFHAEGLTCNIDDFRKVLEAYSSNGRRAFIFQIDGNEGLPLLRKVTEPDSFEVPCVPLFDLSHGAGVLPDAWPRPISDAYHGYAGGLGPENLAEQIPAILKAAGPSRVWIDMETKVRSDSDRQFDLAKVRHCLEIAKPFVGVE